MEKASLRHAHKFIVGRWSNLRSIRRHVIAWLVLIGMLCGLLVVQVLFNYAATTQQTPQNGGVYAEGTVDSFRTLNPLFTTTRAEQSAAKLLFSGLLRYDEQGVLQPDVAKTWLVEERGKKYTVTLRDDIKWHDGAALTADDVVYTIKTIQDPATGATQQQSWRGIKVNAPDKYTVIFTLPNAYAPFTSLLTTPIIPKHILKNQRNELLQESNFSKAPVGSGPFSFGSLTTVDVTSGKTVLQLNASDSYWQGRPYLNRFSLTAYSGEAELVRALKSHEISAANDLSVKSSSEIQKIGGISVHQPRVNNGVYAFLNNESAFLKEVKIRQALVAGTDTKHISKIMRGSPLNGPIVDAQLVNAQKVSQVTHNVAQAGKALDEAGIKKNTKGERILAGKPVVLRIVSVNTPEYKMIIDEIAKQWEEIGIVTQKRFIDPEQIQQSVLQPRDYDVLVYEIEIGGDPDVYAYWHSSQASIMGANFSNYRSTLADDALVAARLRTPWDIRDTRYQNFAEQWVKDAPAIALYQPNLQYAIYGQVDSLHSSDVLPSYTDRFSTVTQWSVQQDRVYKTP